MREKSSSEYQNVTDVLQQGKKEIIAEIHAIQKMLRASRLRKRPTFVKLDS